ncbi:MAG TPA: c-type cytochrome [Balneolaceae bacterium]|nr:c-type cytochrome [Balneolaceae bacterium]
MKRLIGITGFGVLVIILLSCSKQQKNAEASDNSLPHVAAASQVKAGRYLIITGGCNDCHTQGFMQDNNIPESEWMTGSSVGWQGPWGTTYAANLRLSVQNYSKKAWVHMAKTRSTRPPMVWFSLNQMSDKDLKAIYAYLKSLGPKGKPAPHAVPPGQKPKTPYISLMPQNMPQDSVPMNTNK